MLVGWWNCFFFSCGYFRIPWTCVCFWKKVFGVLGSLDLFGDFGQLWCSFSWSWTQFEFRKKWFVNLKLRSPPVWFLKKLALLHSYLLIFVNLLKRTELLLKKVERDDRIWIRKSRMVCKLCEKSSSSTLQASTTASKRMHAVRFFWREILPVAQAAGSGTSNTWAL